MLGTTFFTTNWGGKLWLVHFHRGSPLILVLLCINHNMPSQQLWEKKGETTMLVPKVYLLSAISWSLKWALLVPNVSKMSIISPSINFHSLVNYVSNRIMMWHFLNDVSSYFRFKNYPSLKFDLNPFKVFLSIQFNQINPSHPNLNTTNDQPEREKTWSENL